MVWINASQIVDSICNTEIMTCVSLLSTEPSSRFLREATGGWAAGAANPQTGGTLVYFLFCAVRQIAVCQTLTLCTSLPLHQL